MARKLGSTRLARRLARRPGSGLWRALRRLLLAILLLVLIGAPLWVLAYRFLPPPITILMLERMAAGERLDRRWVPLREVAPSMVRAVIASEDSRFCQHHGFDFGAIRQALKHDETRPGRLRGGSTISQQTAKNVFLWPERSWARKGLEAGFTTLIEALWGKRRIMEVYLDTVEMGHGVFGVEAAARRYFHHAAAELSRAEASRLAAILPSPLKWRAVAPGPYVRRRTGRIEARSATVARDDLAACVLGG